MDDFKAYRAMCANRVRRLERFKKTHSFCSLDRDTKEEGVRVGYTASDSDYASGNERENICALDSSIANDFLLSTTSANAESGTSDEECGHCDKGRDLVKTKDDLPRRIAPEDGDPDPFNMIRQRMIDLMENDVSLLQQLLSLGDKINEVKSLRRSYSETSIDGTIGPDCYREDEDEDQFDEQQPSFAASMSAVTNLYVENEQPQYFSRKNSVLRIPIPPRSSNRRKGSNVRHPSDGFRRPLQLDTCLPSRSPLHSPSSPPSSSDYASSACSTVSSAGGSKLLAANASAEASATASNISPQSIPPINTLKAHCRSSASSVDSGCRRSDSSASSAFSSISSPSPVLRC